MSEAIWGESLSRDRLWPNYARGDWLVEAAVDHGCAIHGYVLMTNHVHLLITPRTPDSLPRTMQSLGLCYVRNVNATYRRTGTLWEGRYRAAPIDGEAYFLAVRHPRDYRWSSYRAHAEGRADLLLTSHERLGRTAATRQQEYRALFRAALNDDFVQDLRAATNGGWALGDARFKQQIAQALGRRVVPLPKGTPAQGARRAASVKSSDPNSSTIVPLLRALFPTRLVQMQVIFPTGYQAPLGA